MSHASDNVGLASGLARLGAAERRVIEHLLGHRRITRDVNREMEDARTFGERPADRIAIRMLERLLARAGARGDGEG